MLLGAIDIGSNAVRFLVSSAEKFDEWHFQRVEYLRYPLRLGEDVFTKKAISKVKIEKLLKLMDAFSTMFEVFEVEGYKACATSAMRDAINGKEVIALVKEKTGVQIEIIDGNKEADLIDRAIIRTLTKGNFIHVDVGGGSTELNLISDFKKIASRSFNIGTVRAIHHGISNEQWAEIEQWVHQHANGNYSDIAAVGTGGNIKKLHELSEIKENEAVSFDKLVSLTDNIRKMTIKERMRDFKLNQDRADVIVPAAEIFINIMKWSKSKKIFAPNVGLVDGIIADQFYERYS